MLRARQKPAGEQAGLLRRLAPKWARGALLAAITALRRSLRARVALGVSLPILLALASISAVHYWRERQLLEQQAQLMAVQLGRVVASSLRYSLLVDDHVILQGMLDNVGHAEPVERVQIVGAEGQVMADSGHSEAGHAQRVVEPGCTECHRLSAETRPASVLLAGQSNVLRVAVPLDNEPQCAACHPASQVHLGILLVDISTLAMRQHIFEDLKIDLAISSLITILLSLGVFALMHRLIVSRVEAFRRPLAAYAAGQFETRLPVAQAGDEMSELALAFNRMADELERKAREETERGELRQRAIVEERERIARELHDGLAQVLGYVTTKATAVRLLLKRQQAEAAEQHLLQLEEAAGELFVDVREAILGLRMTGRRNTPLAAMLGDYAAHFSRLSSLPVEVDIAPGACGLPLPAETELQLLRIVQEALTNVRKHAQATAVQVRVSNGGLALEVRVSDDGQGFQPVSHRHSGRPQFGLSCMRERAEAIGAELQIESQPGNGTCVHVKLPLPQNGA